MLFAENLYVMEKYNPVAVFTNQNTNILRLTKHLHIVKAVTRKEENPVKLCGKDCDNNAVRSNLLLSSPLLYYRE